MAAVAAATAPKTNNVSYAAEDAEEDDDDEEYEEKIVFVEDNTNIKNVEKLVKVNVIVSFVCMGVSIANVVALFLKK